MIQESTDVTRTVVKLDEKECDEYMCNTRHLYGVETKIAEKTSFLGIKTLNKEIEKRVYCPKHQGDSLDLVKEARRREHEVANQELKKHRKRQNEMEIKKIIRNSVLPVLKFGHGSIKRPKDEDFSIEVNNFRKGIGILERCSNEHPIFFYHEYDQKYSIINSGCMNGSEFKEYGDESKIIAEDIKQDYDSIDFNRYEYQILRSNEITGKKVPDAMHNINRFENVNFSNGNIYDEGVFRVGVSHCPICEDSIWSSDTKYVRLILSGEKRLIVIHDSRGCNKVMGEVNPMFCGRENYATIK